MCAPGAAFPDRKPSARRRTRADVPPGTHQRGHVSPRARRKVGPIHADAALRRQRHEAPAAIPGAFYPVRAADPGRQRRQQKRCGSPPNEMTEFLSQHVAPDARSWVRTREPPPMNADGGVSAIARSIPSRGSIKTLRPARRACCGGRSIWVGRGSTARQARSHATDRKQVRQRPFQPQHEDLSGGL